MTGGSVAAAFEQARAIAAGQRAALQCAAAAGAPQLPRDVLDDVESQFLWGVYSELLARGPATAIGGHDAVIAHLIHHFAADRGLDFETARATARGVEDLFNQAEPLFESIAERGRLAVSRGGSRHFLEICHALTEASGQ